MRVSEGEGREGCGVMEGVEAVLGTHIWSPCFVGGWSSS